MNRWRWRFLLALGLLLALVSADGCTSVTYSDGDGRQVTVTRWMSDSGFDELRISRPDGTQLILTGYRSQAEKVIEAAVAGAVRGLKP